MISDLWACLTDLVLPRRCVACGRPGSPWCPPCRPEPEPAAVAGGAVACTPYGGAVRRALIAYKERGRRDLAAPLALLLAESVRAVLAGSRGPVVLVTVPSSRAAVAARGGDHVERLARRVAGLTGLPIARGALAQARSVLDSAGLGAADRSRNLAGAMVARPPPPGRQAVVLDDIVTTGATLSEAHRALRTAHWQVSGAAVIASTPRRHGRNWQAVADRSSVWMT